MLACCRRIIPVLEVGRGADSSMDVSGTIAHQAICMRVDGMRSATVDGGFTLVLVIDTEAFMLV